ncbi:Carbon catabolite repressor protein 4-like protein [Thalictrum thalictroides]|uniref:Carbon catabolite repressor protein 4-like protein n=1 Tax=Thalictrum thalictroides TaxID=46969 RepID=A0A7J6V3G3_THATH|nr:Carbon catabolite repressor protein 4-like protein [Thalictrum thalictroides]
MKWDQRKRLICEELIGWDSDIICLQEVDKYNDILRSLEQEGYVGTYKKRTGDSVDGCAMFWKTDRICLLEAENIEFEGFGLHNNVAQISVFEMRKANSRRVLVGNIHVLFKPNRGDIKLGQIQLLLSRAKVLSEKWGGMPIVLVGDFNSTPQSAIYHFLSSSELDVTLHDKKYLSGQQSSPPPQSGSSQGHVSRAVTLMDRFLKNSWTDAEVRNLTGNTNCTIVKHPLKLNSSYASVKVTEGSKRTRDSYGEPLATSFHSKFLGTVDYLWYSEGIVPTRVLDTPPIEILQKTRGLPHKTLGSDHLALLSEFAFA